MESFASSDQVGLLNHYIRSGRLPQTLLFAGPAGSGKTRLALEFFKSLNCLESPGSPCGACAVCFKLRHGAHPDLVVFEPPAGGKQIEALREVLDGIRLRPFEARQRFVMIEPAEALNKASANALLKALEEPPPATVFVLISHNPALLLSTIVSRCQILRFTASGSAADLSLAAVCASGAVEEPEAFNAFRLGLIQILGGAEPLAVMTKIQPLDKDDLAQTLIALDSVLRDLWLRLGCGGEPLNRELEDLALRLDYYELEDLWALLRGLRRGGENQNLKAVFAEIAIRLGRMAA